MNEWNPRQTVIEMFWHLRAAGFPLGLRELLGAQQAVADGWGAADPTSLRQVIRLLWCSSLEEIGKFEVEWASLIDTPSAEWPRPFTPAEPPADRPLDRPTPGREGEQLVSQPPGLETGALGVGQNPGDRGRLRAAPGPDQGDVAENDGKDIVEVVGDPPGQGAE